MPFSLPWRCGKGARSAEGIGGADPRDAATGIPGKKGRMRCLVRQPSAANSRGSAVPIGSRTTSAANGS